MANDINSVVLTGNLCADPELVEVGKGDKATSVLKLRLASNEYAGKGPDGNHNTRACFTTVELWGARAEGAYRFLRKGMKVGISGKLQQDTWEADDGTKRSVHKIRAFNLEPMTPRTEGASDGDAVGEEAPF